MMTARAALDRGDRKAPRTRSSANVAYAADWRPTIKSVIPVVRRAILVKHVPRLNRHHTQQVHAAVEKAWDTWRGRYVAQVARFSGLGPLDLQVVETEKVRLKQDGKTPMLDLPRIRTRRHSARQFDLRNCVALCIDDLSSKVWARVGLPDQDGIDGCPTGELRPLVAAFRSLSRDCDEWFYEEFSCLAQDVLSGIERRRTGTLEVTTVGLKVDGDVSDDFFDDWLLDGTEGPNFRNEELCEFLMAAADLAFHPAELGTREPDSFWMSIPSAVQLPNGDLASRKALYLVRPVGEVAQVVGIGLDDSQEGDLASQAALKISRLVANRV